MEAVLGTTLRHLLRTLTIAALVAGLATAATAQSAPGGTIQGKSSAPKAQPSPMRW